MKIIILNTSSISTLYLYYLIYFIHQLISILTFLLHKLLPIILNAIPIHQIFIYLFLSKLNIICLFSKIFENLNPVTTYFHHTKKIIDMKFLYMINLLISQDFINNYLRKLMLQKNYNKLNLEFENMIKLIQSKEWKTAVNQAKQIYNIRLYNIEKFTIYKVRDLYYNINHSFYPEQIVKIKWHENQLRIYIWLLLTYSKAISKSIDQFDELQWNKFSNIFIGKSPDLCQFQFFNLKKNLKRSQKWKVEEDQLLLSIINNKNRQIKNKWNEVAKQLFLKSQKKYFRSAKQCRQRWNNFLDPNKKHGYWTNEEDLILIQQALVNGKKWSNIARTLDQKRTEHMVKNRFRSLLEKQKRNERKKKARSEIELLEQLQKKIQKKIKNQEKKFKVKKEQSNPNPHHIISNITHHQIHSQQNQQNNNINAEINLPSLQNTKTMIATPTTPSIIPYSPIQYSPFPNINFQYNFAPNFQMQMIYPNPFLVNNYFLFQNFNKFT